MDAQALEPQRVIDADSSRRRERTLIASLLDLDNSVGDGKIGPNISSALAHCPEYWDDPEARIVGVAIRACLKSGRPITLCSVSEYLPKQYRLIINGKQFADGISMELAEYEAFDLLLRYRGKRLSQLLGKAWQQSREHPERAESIKRATIKQLEEF